MTLQAVRNDTEGNFIVMLEYANEDPDEAWTEILWEGNLWDIPEEYLDKEVVEITQSQKYREKHKKGFYVKLKK